MNILILPLVIPLLTAIFGLGMRKASLLRPALFITSSLVQVGISLTLCSATLDTPYLGLELGGWKPPFGIIFVVDTLSAIMLCLSSLTGLAATLYSYARWIREHEHPFRAPLLQLITVGINLAFLTSDLFNLFVAFEVMLLASYGLLTLENPGRQLKNNLSYIVINVVGSGLFLCLAGFAYGYWGTLNFADLSERMAADTNQTPVLYFALLATCVFGLKAGLFPLYFWLPKSYPTAPPAISGYFAGMLTKVGVYVLLRLYTTILPHDLAPAHEIIGWLSVATMIFGVLGAIAQNTIRGILSWHIISQIGYMTLCIGLFSPIGVTACILYITHHIIVKGSLFFIGGTAAFLQRTESLDRMGGIWRFAPLLGLLFLFQSLSLAGIPPLSGFWGKYLIIAEGFSQGKDAFVIGSLIASILTLFSMLKIWNGAFWGAIPDKLMVWDRNASRSFWSQVGVCAILVCISLVIGLGMPHFLSLAEHASESAMNQRGFIQFVFELRGKP